jgi:hypothetical protein
VGWTTGQGGLCVGGFARRSAPRKEPGNLPRYDPGAGEGRSWPSATTRLDWRIALVSPTPPSRKASVDAALEALRNFRGEPQEHELPSAPRRPIHVLAASDRPQPRLDRDREGGMAVSVGRVREDRLFGLKLQALVHNTIRGAAGAAILNAELLQARGLLP